MRSKREIIEEVKKFVEKFATVADVTVYYKFHGTYVIFWILKGKGIAEIVQRELEREFGKYWSEKISSDRIKFTVMTVL